MNILLIDEHPLFRFAVKGVLEQHASHLRCAEAHSIEQALPLLDAQHWDLAIFDPATAGSDSLEVLTRLLRRHPELRVLVSSDLRAGEFASRVLELGAAGYFDKHGSLEELTFSVDRILAGGRYIGPELAEFLADRATSPKRERGHAALSAQEYRVMLQLAHGRKIADIGEAMHLSPKTVSTYRTRVLRKLGVTSNADLVRYCIREGVLLPGVPE